MTGGRTITALTFAMCEAIDVGDADDLLLSVRRSVLNRLRVLQNPDTPPADTEAMIAQRQLWVWMYGPGKPHWEIRGTGALL